jgi:hypothetical protein
MPFPIHPHMLRHACGFKLANDGHDTQGVAGGTDDRLARMGSRARRRWHVALSRALPCADRCVAVV